MRQLFLHKTTEDESLHSLVSDIRIAQSRL